VVSESQSDQPARIGFSVTVGDTHYYLTSLMLAPHDTRAIDLRQLRDAQVADFKKNKIPAGASDGSVDWVRLDNVPVMGRVAVIMKAAGMASSYDCCTCACPLSFMGQVTVSPTSFAFLPGETEALSCSAKFEDCNYYVYWYDDTSWAWWSSSNTSVVTMDTSVNGQADAQSAGTATVTAQNTDCGYWYFNPVSYTCECSDNNASGSGSTTANVVSVSIKTQSNSNNFVFVGTTDSQVTQYNTQLAVGIPDGGSYSWSVSPESVTIVPNDSNSAYLPTFTGNTPSASVGSTTEYVTYTVNTKNAQDNRAITLRKFNALATPSPVSGCPDDPNAPPPGQGYIEEFVYKIITIPGSELVQSGFPNMAVTETSNVTSVTPSNFQFTPVTGKGGTDDSSQVDDCLGIPSSTALPSNLVVCVAQTISVGGIQVRANTLKYTNTSVSIVSTCP
jgi:hypothetical protein